MLRELLHKIGATAMALLLLMSTVLFTVDKHFCGDTLVDFALFSDAKKCGIESVDSNKASTVKKSCCKDVLEVVSGQEVVKSIDANDFNVEPPLFLVPNTATYPSLFVDATKAFVPHKHYDPPNLTIDRQVRDQVFII